LVIKPINISDTETRVNSSPYQPDYSLQNFSEFSKEINETFFSED